MQGYLLKSYVRTYETSKLIRRNLAQTFETCYLWLRTEGSDSLLSLFLAIAVAGYVVLWLLATLLQLFVLSSYYRLVLYLCALIPYTEQWRLQHIDVSLLYQFGEELQEEGYHKQTYMHTIHISISSNDNLVISQVVQTVFYIEGCLKQVKLLILIHEFLCEPVAVLWFTTQGEYSLSVHVTTLRYRTTGRIALGNKDARFFLTVVLGIREVYAAVAQFSVVQVCLLGTFPCQLRHARHSLTLSLACLYLLLYYLCYVKMSMQIIIHLRLYEVTYVFVYRNAVWRHCERAQLNLCLRLEYWLLYVYGDGSNESIAYVAVFIFAEVFLHRSCQMFLEGALVGSALRSVLTIYERIILLAILVSVSEGYLYVLPLHVDYRIKRFAGHLVTQQILQTIS